MKVWFYGWAMVALLLSGCKNATIDNSEEIMTRREQKYKDVGHLFDEDTLLFGADKNKAKDHDPAHLAVNRYLWRAALDTLSFMPLTGVDPFGGVILTDWYSSDATPTERVKVDVMIQSRQLRSDGVKVRLFRQVLKDGVWMTAPSDNGAERTLENTILRQARTLKIQGKKQG